MQAGDYGERRSEPWTYRNRIVPLRTYCGRVVHRRQKHFFRASDAARIMAKLEPREQDEGESWASNVIAVLRAATITMLERILPFLPEVLIQELYDWGIGILDKVFQQIPSDDPAGEKRKAGYSALIHLAQESGVEITIHKKG